jgi:predicted RNA binding protein YcfA (HicA-like mRNA interferase family)
MSDSIRDKLMSVRKTSEFTKVIEKEFGYHRKSKHAGSHVVYEAQGRVQLSIPLHTEISPGTRRGLVKQIMGEKYYD